VCYDFFYNVCLNYLRFWEEFSEISSKMSKRLHVKYSLFLSNFNETWIFSTDLRKKLKYEVLSKSVHWEPSCSMFTEGLTDARTDGHDEAFRNFANAPASRYLALPTWKRYLTRLWRLTSAVQNLSRAPFTNKYFRESLCANSLVSLEKNNLIRHSSNSKKCFLLYCSNEMPR
jgi:hypothetical protein